MSSTSHARGTIAPSWSIVALVATCVLFASCDSFEASDGLPRDYAVIEMTDAPVDLQDALEAIEAGQVAIVIIEQPPSSIVPNYYSVAESGSAKWKLQGYEVSFFAIRSEEQRFVLPPSGETIGLEETDLEFLLSAVDRFNDSGPPYVVLSDERAP